MTDKHCIDCGWHEVKAGVAEDRANGQPSEPSHDWCRKAGAVIHNPFQECCEQWADEAQVAMVELCGDWDEIPY